MKYKRALSVAVLLGTAAIALSSCSSDSSSNAQKTALETAQSRKNYIPKNDVEAKNYNARQALADDPATLIWCSVFPTNPNIKPFTIPIVGKLTSGNKRPDPTLLSKTGNDYTYNPDLPGSDGMYGTSGEYRYGFDPAGQYHDFYNLETYCTTVPDIIQKQTTMISVANPSTDLNSLDVKLQEALKKCRDKNVDPSVACPEAVRILAGS